MPSRGSRKTLLFRLVSGTRRRQFQIFTSQLRLCLVRFLEAGTAVRCNSESMLTSGRVRVNRSRVSLTLYVMRLMSPTFKSAAQLRPTRCLQSLAPSGASVAALSSSTVFALASDHS